MRNVTIKGLLTHKLRLALTALAIVLGVTFISGTFILTDTLHNTFTVLFGNVYAKVDFQVRGVAQLGSGANATRNELPASLVTTVRKVPGVEAAEGGIEGYAQFVSHNGQAIQTGGAPTLAVSFDPDQQISDLRLVAGGPPVNADDVVMDAGTASKYDFAVGQQVRVLSAGPPKTYTITGIAQFGSANNLAGATLAAFTLPTAQAVTGEKGQLDFIDVVTAPGASKPAVQRAIARALPPGVQVVTGQTVENENTSSIDQALSFFSTALLIFAFISLFVGGFTIFNTFSIIVGQRTRELALLRIVGASRRQVFGSVLAEAAITGLVSSVIGLGLGVLAALGLQALLRGFGIVLPPGPLGSSRAPCWSGWPSAPASRSWPRSARPGTRCASRRSPRSTTASRSPAPRCGAGSPGVRAWPESARSCSPSGWPSRPFSWWARARSASSSAPPCWPPRSPARCPA
jgi:putative ABC transport system permease protein